MKRFMWLAALAAGLALAGASQAQVCNVKVVTDANPDYTDIGSMIHSITSNWQTDKEKCWAIWYWNKIGRRQTAPIHLHRTELTDPIRQFNDYGFTMCSTVAGVNCSIWGAMGYNVKFWDISLHTVPEVFYDGNWHMYDSSLSALYTTCDGSRLAGVTEIGADGACAASGGKTEPGHIAKYHCLTATSPNGYLEGCDTIRSLNDEYKCFNPRGLKYRNYYNNWDLGHRYILNLREGEVYMRFYRRLDADSPKGTVQNEKRPNFKSDPAYFVPNEKTGLDPECINPRYGLRGNGRRTWTPPLTAAGIAANAFTLSGVTAGNGGVQPAKAGQPGEVVFKVEGANVITSLTLKASFLRKTGNDAASIAISTNNGLAWKEVWNAGDKTGDVPAEVELLDPVNGLYEVLVKVTLKGQADATNAQLASLSFDTTTEVNAKTQPRLKLGKNTVYVGAGDQTESIVFWPDLRSDKYKQYVVDEHNVKVSDDPKGWKGSFPAVKGGEDAWVTFRIDAPGDITRITYGGRFCNRGKDAHMSLLHSFDGGKTWAKSYTLTDTTAPWDVIHYEKVDAVPAGTRSVLFKYLWNAFNAGDDVCSLYTARMEANYKPANPGFKPMDVTFTWNERQEDYSLVKRSHTQLVDKAPCTYTINVGGVDHPVMESLRVSLKGAAGEAKYGYSDGQDAGGEKFVEHAVSYGKNLAEGKPYASSSPCDSGWGSGDANGKKLTDGIVGPPEAGGAAYAATAIWKRGNNTQLTVDLGKVEKCAAFRIQTSGSPFWNAIKGEIKDKVEVLVSADDKDYKSVGFFNFNLRWKDLPVNHPWNDDETFTGHNFVFVPPQPVEARYVRFAVTPARILAISELQVLDSIKYEPFDLRIALPDGKDRSDITAYNPKHTPMKASRPNAPAGGENKGGGRANKGGKANADGGPEN
jgi:hypothetical protein